jgi:hypothetical protein
MGLLSAAVPEADVLPSKKIGKPFSPRTKATDAGAETLDVCKAVSGVARGVATPNGLGAIGTTALPGHEMLGVEGATPLRVGFDLLCCAKVGAMETANSTRRESTFFIKRKVVCKRQADLGKYKGGKLLL